LISLLGIAQSVFDIKDGQAGLLKLIEKPKKEVNVIQVTAIVEAVGVFPIIGGVAIEPDRFL